MTPKFSCWLEEKSIITEMWGSFSYKIPHDKEQQLYDFYMLEFLLPKGVHLFLKPMDFGGDEMFHEDKVYYMLYEVAKELLPELKKNLLDAVYYSVASEMAHIFDAYHDSEGKKNLYKNIKRSLGPEYSDLFRKYVDQMSIHNASPSKDLYRDKAYNPDISGTSSTYDKRLQWVLHLNPDKNMWMTLAGWAFKNAQWNSAYGGKAWAMIANAWLKLNAAQSGPEIMKWIDHVYDLQHNTGSVLNKVSSYMKDGGFNWLAKALDDKFYIKSPWFLVDRISPQFKKLAPRAIRVVTGQSWEQFMAKKPYYDEIRKREEIERDWAKKKKQYEKHSNGAEYPTPKPQFPPMPPESEYELGGSKAGYPFKKGAEPTPSNTPKATPAPYNTPGTAETPYASKGPKVGKAMSNYQGMMEFTCPWCGKTNYAPLNGGGKETKCTKCHKSLIVPQLGKYSHKPGETEHQGFSDQIQFNCPNCKKDLIAGKAQAGKTLKCPKCYKDLTVPNATPEVKPDPLAYKSVTPEVKPLNPTPKPSLFDEPKTPEKAGTPLQKSSTGAAEYISGSPGALKFACPYCKKDIASFEKSAGKVQKCPKCGNIVVVPKLGEFAQKSFSKPALTTPQEIEQYWKELPKAMSGQMKITRIALAMGNGSIEGSMNFLKTYSNEFKKHFGAHIDEHFSDIIDIVKDEGKAMFYFGKQGKNSFPYNLTKSQAWHNIENKYPNAPHVYIGIDGEKKVDDLLLKHDDTGATELIHKYTLFPKLVCRSIAIYLKTMLYFHEAQFAKGDAPKW